MNTTLYIGDSAFSELGGEWNAIASGSMTDTPFQRLAYQKAWWTHLKPQDGTLVTVATRDDDNRLSGIGCFYNVSGTLYFNGCVEETDYLDLIAPAEKAESVWKATLNCLESIEAPAWQAMELCNIPSGSPTRSILPAIANNRGYAIEEEVAEVCPVITLPHAFDQYLDSLDSKQRRELNRKLRRAEAAEVTTTVIGQNDDLHVEVENFLDLLQKSTFEKRDWLNEGRRALFHEVARAAQEDGSLQLMFTSIEGRRAAALFNFDHNQRIWVYNSGLNPESFPALSPGVVLTAMAIEHAIELGRQEFDFLRGDEEYKYRFGAQDTQIYRQRIERYA